MRHMLNPLDFSLEETDNLLELAADIEKDRSRYAHVCDGKKLATLFYELPYEKEYRHNFGNMSCCLYSRICFSLDFRKEQ